MHLLFLKLRILLSLTEISEGNRLDKFNGDLRVKNFADTGIRTHNLPTQSICIIATTSLLAYTVEPLLAASETLST